MIFAKIGDVSGWSWRLFRSRLLILGLSRHWETLATWGFLRWILIAHQIFGAIFVEVDNLSEGSWRCSHDPSGLEIISALTKAREVRFFALSSRKPSDVCGDIRWGQQYSHSRETYTAARPLCRFLANVSIVDLNRYHHKHLMACENLKQKTAPP